MEKRKSMKNTERKRNVMYRTVFKLQQIPVNRWTEGRKHINTDAKRKYLIKEDQVKFYYRKIIKVKRTDKTGAEFKERK